MNELVNILVLTLPLILVLTVVVLGIVYFVKLERLRISQKSKEGNAASVLTVRLQAYERLVLFLERINPQQLVLRNNDAGLSTKSLQWALLQNIREEYEHNLVQQLYVSAEVWALIEQARSWVAMMVNEASEKLDENAAANDLAVAVIEMQMAADKDYITMARTQLKKEVQELF